MSQLEQLTEAIPFFTHEQAPVRLQAIHLVSGFTTLESNRLMLAKLGFLPHLIALIKDQAKEVRKASLLALINMSQSDAVRSQLLTVPKKKSKDESKAIDNENSILIIDRLLQALIDKDNPLHALEIMLLSNLSGEESAAKAIIREGTPLEGLHVIRLIQRFIQPAVPFSQESLLPDHDCADTYQFFANILTNISQLPSGRKIILDKERKIIQSLLPYVSSKNIIRKLGVLRTIRNCCLESSGIRYLLSAEINLAPYILVPLIGPEVYPPHEQEGMLIELIRYIRPDKKREANSQARKIILEILMACAQDGPSRIYLQSIRTAEILRELHYYEQEKHNKDLDDYLYELVPYFLKSMDDQNVPTGSLAAIQDAATAAATAATSTTIAESKQEIRAELKFLDEYKDESLTQQMSNAQISTTNNNNNNDDSNNNKNDSNNKDDNDEPPELIDL